MNLIRIRLILTEDYIKISRESNLFKKYSTMSPHPINTCFIDNVVSHPITPGFAGAVY